jgi:hypothetical protein
MIANQEHAVAELHPKDERQRRSAQALVDDLKAALAKRLSATGRAKPEENPDQG